MTILQHAPTEVRQERQRRARAVRRALADITPSNSGLQEQSPFFTKLPAEIRFLIFQLLLSQTHDHNRPINIHSISPLYRPGHTYRTKVHTALLLTCRLVYYEAHSIPIRSATHHFRHSLMVRYLTVSFSLIRALVPHRAWPLPIHVYRFELTALKCSTEPSPFLKPAG